MDELVRVDDTAWPLLVIHVPAVLDAPAIQSMFRGMDRILLRQSQFATLVDTRALKQFPNAVERKLLAQKMAERTTAEALFNIGNAIVIASPAARTVLTAIQWLRRPVTVQSFVSTPAAAIDWCCMRIEQVGLTSNEAITALRNSDYARAE